jgi:hypothetical protein
MPKPPSMLVFTKQLLWHCLIGVALGVLCGGLLLNIGSAHFDAFIHGPDTMIARLRFLLTVALFFGAGSTLTGTVFLVNEKARSNSSQ